MTPEAFREMALGLGAVQAKRVFETVRFRVDGKTLATLDWPSQGWVVLKLAAADQRRLLALSPALMAEPSPRGKRGVTLVRLRAMTPDLMAQVLAAAWRQAYGKVGRREQSRRESATARLEA